MNRSDFSFTASLSCMDLANVEQQMGELNKTNIESYHYDVVDGKFNRCFGFGDEMLKVFSRLSEKPIHTHLAVEQPLLYIEPMIRAGATYIGLHYESAELDKAIRLVKDLGGKVVLAFKADTVPDEGFLKYIDEIEWILKLTVNPGFAGQPIQKEALTHITKIKQILDNAKKAIPIEADGNMNTKTISMARLAGATKFTGGTSGLFKKDKSIAENLSDLEKALYEDVIVS